MKQIKYISSFFLILILQFSFANSSSGVFVDKELCIGSIEFWETNKPISVFSRPVFTENDIFKASFLEVESCRSAFFCDGYAGLVESWKRVSDAIPTSSGTTTFARDIATLERVSELSDATSAFRKKFPDTWESELSDLISKNSELRCTACGNMSSNNSLLSRLPSMDEMLENINHLAEYRDIPGFDNAYAAFKSNANNRDGINHMVKYMRNNTEELGGNITVFEFRYDDDLLRRADLAAGDRLYEFKSWTKNADQPWNGFFGGSGNSYDQFLDYLRNTDDFDNLRYVFNSGKATESEVKAAFKNLFENKKSDIFSTFSDDLKDVLELETIADLNSTKIDEIIDVLVKVE